MCGQIRGFDFRKNEIVVKMRADLHTLCHFTAKNACDMKSEKKGDPPRFRLAVVYMHRKMAPWRLVYGARRCLY